MDRFYWIIDKLNGTREIALKSENGWFLLSKVGTYNDEFDERYHVLIEIEPPRRSE